MLKMASDAANSENDAEMIRECEQYVEQNNIQSILKDAIVQLCVAKPANPFKFLREHFEKLEKVSIVAMFLTSQSELSSESDLPLDYINFNRRLLSPLYE